MNDERSVHQVELNHDVYHFFQDNEFVGGLTKDALVSALHTAADKAVSGDKESFLSAHLMGAYAILAKAPERQISTQKWTGQESSAMEKARTAARIIADRSKKSVSTRDLGHLVHHILDLFGRAKPRKLVYGDPEEVGVWWDPEETQYVVTHGDERIAHYSQHESDVARAAAYGYSRALADAAECD